MTATTENAIKIERQPSSERLQELGVSSWPVWEKEASEFPWTYEERETCYLLAGEVIVTPDGGEPVQIQKGDLVTFPQGMSCTWNIVKDVRKHYNFG
ncbi:cupin domain-containing protein [Baaleninema sp.]|uniref:cupin domain-containing protein n=1 Tax=Baaleninema sp. TaxID=3101197 RepID=UPI003D033E23